MGLLNTVKDLFTKAEVTEEAFEYESIDNFLAQQKEENGNGAKDDVAYKCDQIIDATYQMEELRVEYDMVTSYFQDIQTIEELPQNIQGEIADIAGKIALLENETSEFLHADDRISDANFRMIQGLEKDLREVFGKLKELEDMDLKIKRDLKHLEAERNSLEYMQSSIGEKQRKLRTFISGFGALSILSVLILALIGVFTNTSLILPILLILLVIAGLAAMTVVVYKRLSYEFKLCEIKENRAINLENKVKIKYVNNTSTLEYLYGKYNIKNLRELEYLYDQYLIMVDEVRKYQRTAGDLHKHCEQLTKLLFSHGIKDPDIWTKQSRALIDKREMVEVKHSLNVRRQKLREQITYNEELRLNGLKDIQKMLKVKPELREQVKKELEVYHVYVDEE